jgi:uncharacterized membrane protein
MTYEHLAYLHLGTVQPAFVIGTFLLPNRKGTPVHKGFGKVYLSLMAVTAITAPQTYRHWFAAKDADGNLYAQVDPRA